MHLNGQPICNYVLIAFTCGFSWLGFRSAAFVNKYIFWPQAILGGREYYRLITSGFLHLDPVHLLVNMLSLYFFGPLVEQMLGPLPFLIIYFAALIGGNLLSLYLHRHHEYRALGASGAVSGMVLAHILLFPGGGIGMFFVPFYAPAWLYAALFLAISFRGMHRDNHRIGHDAHLGGALVGLFAAATFEPRAILLSPWMFGGVTVATILLLIYLERNPLLEPMEGLDFTRKNSAEPPEHQREKRMDAILQKVSDQGIQSLTEEERNFLNDVSVGYRRRATRQKPRWYFPF